MIAQVFQLKIQSQYDGARRGAVQTFLRSTAAAKLLRRTSVHRTDISMYPQNRRVNKRVRTYVPLCQRALRSSAWPRIGAPPRTRRPPPRLRRLRPRLLLRPRRPRPHPSRSHCRRCRHRLRPRHRRPRRTSFGLGCDRLRESRWREATR